MFFNKPNSQISIDLFLAFDVSASHIKSSSDACDVLVTEKNEPFYVTLAL